MSRVSRSAANASSLQPMSIGMSSTDTSVPARPARGSKRPAPLPLAATGATLVPQGFQAELQKKLVAWGGMRRPAVSSPTTTGDALPWPTFDDTSNAAEWLTEGADATTQADPTISNVTLHANLLSSNQVRLSVQIEQDSSV